MPIFSIITLIGSIYILLHNNTLKNKYLMMLTLASAAEVIRIRGMFLPGVIGLAQATIFQSITIFLAILILYKNRERISFSFFLLSSMLLLSVLLGGGFEYVYTFNQPVIPRHLSNDSIGSPWDWFIAGMISRQVESYSIIDFISGFFNTVLIIFNIYCVKTICEWKDIELLVIRLIHILKYYLLIIYLEFISKNVLNIPDLWPEVQQLFCGPFSSGDLNQTSNKRGAFYSLIGFTQEPSFLVMSLAFLLFLVFVSNRVREKYPQRTSLPYTSWYQIVLIVLPMLTSGGFSSIWFIVNLAVIYYIIHDDVCLRTSVYKCLLCIKIFVPLSILLIVIYVLVQFSDTNYSARIEGVQLFFTTLVTTGTLPFSIVTDTSVLARFSSIVLTFRDFLERPLFGLGIGMEYAHCFSVTMLADFGILGSYFWWKILRYSVYKEIRYDYCALFVYFWVIGLIAGDFGVRFLRQFSNLILVEATCLYCSGINTWKTKDQNERQ